jgi:[ribosomal protein S18]-alanine N-acetyltransferase
MVWQLRRADEDDLDSIMDIESTVFGTDAWSHDMMRAELASDRTYYVVAFPQDAPERIEGYAGLAASVGAPESDIQTIAVAETARRHGLGRVLMQTLIGEARTRGAREVFLEVRADNPNAQSLYLSLGFEEIATRVAYYQPDGVDAMIMRLAVPEPRVSPAVGA